MRASKSKLPDSGGIGSWEKSSSSVGGHFQSRCMMG